MPISIAVVDMPEEIREQLAVRLELAINEWLVFAVGCGDFEESVLHIADCFYPALCDAYAIGMVMHSLTPTALDTMTVNEDRKGGKH